MKLLLSIFGGLILCMVLFISRQNEVNANEMLNKFMRNKESKFQMQKSDSNYVSLLYVPTQIAVLNALRTSDFTKEDYILLESKMSKTIRFELRNYGIHQKKKIDILNEFGHREYERSIRAGLSLVIDGKSVFPIEFVPERTYGMLPYDTYFVSFTGESNFKQIQVLMKFQNPHETLSWVFKKEEIEYNDELHWN